jgi:hypothetical protein
MNIVVGNGQDRKVYPLPSAQEIRQSWDTLQYRDLHKAVCDIFGIVVPEGYNARPKAAV